MCSTIVASAMGIMVMIDDTISPQSGDEKIENTVSLILKGNPIHEASATAEKSALPNRAATAYEPITPNRMGTILTMPRPQMLLTTMITMASSAIHQSAAQLAMAEPDRIKPIDMMMGPVTMGGK